MQTNYITFKVPSKMYGVTDCVVTDIARAIKTGFAPCGSGEDYKFTPQELEQLKRIAAGENIEFKRDALKKFVFKFKARELGAIGKLSTYKRTVKAKNYEEAKLMLYEKLEHIQQINCNEYPV